MRVLNAAQMREADRRTIEEKGLAVEGAERLVNAFAVEEPVIEDRDDRVLLVVHAAVDVHRRRHVQ